jgi:hypothetical protein
MTSIAAGAGEEEEDGDEKGEHGAETDDGSASLAVASAETITLVMSPVPYLLIPPRQLSGRTRSGSQLSGTPKSGRQLSDRQLSGRQLSGRQLSGRQRSGSGSLLEQQQKNARGQQPSE